MFKFVNIVLAGLVLNSHGFHIHFASREPG